MSLAEQGSLLFEGGGSAVHDRARRWVSSEWLATTGCIERLAGIRNDAVNVDAQASELRRMRQHADVMRYLESLLALAPSSTANERSRPPEHGGEPR